MQPLFEHRLELAGYRTRALELEGDGPPLLLLHGYADSADTWRLLLDRLAHKDRRAVALDMPGFGAAGRLDEHEPILPQLDRFATAALEAFAPEGGAIVCGNSLGGCVALRLAEHAAEQGLAGVMPVAPAGLDMARWFGVIQRDPVLRALLAAPVPIPTPVLHAAVGAVYKRLAFHRPASIDPAVARGFASHFTDRATTARVLATARRLLPELQTCLHPERIACPVLLVWGTNDAMVFRTGAERVLQSHADARLATLDHCGHCPQIEAPDRLLDLLLDFAPAAAHLA